jgi:hypothetical protein
MKETKVLHADSCSDQDLDVLLRSYFQKEMASPWPAWQTPKQQHKVTLASQAPFGAGSTRSYLALAASIALMIFGFLLVSDKLHTSDALQGKHERIGYDDPQIKKERIKISGGQSQYQFDVEGRP